MQASAPNADSTRAWKVGMHRRPAFNEAYAAKIKGLFRLKCDAEIAQSVNGFRHQPFAASFVDGRPGDARHADLEALFARSARTPDVEQPRLFRGVQRACWTFVWAYCAAIVM